MDFLIGITLALIFLELALLRNTIIEIYYRIEEYILEGDEKC